MSTTADIPEQIDDDTVLEVPETAIGDRTEHTRSFEVELAEGDGRTIEAMIAPYDAPAVVADPPTFRPYREQFARGAFEAQLRAPNRVRAFLNFEHEQGLRGIIGHAAELDDREDGLLGRFRVHENADGDKALQLVHEKLLRGMSLEFKAIRSQVVGGVVTRLRAHFDKVSLCRAPAYPNALVLNVREEPTGLSVAEFEAPPAMGEERLERLAALGIDTKLRTFVDTTWDGSPSRWADADAYCRSCLIDDNPAGAAKVIAKCHLPIREPDSGAVNVNAVRNALVRVSQVATSPANRVRARARLQQLLAESRARP